MTIYLYHSFVDVPCSAVCAISYHASLLIGFSLILLDFPTVVVPFLWLTTILATLVCVRLSSLVQFMVVNPSKHISNHQLPAGYPLVKQHSYFSQQLKNLFPMLEARFAAIRITCRDRSAGIYLA
jgi:hypothetical protein